MYDLLPLRITRALDGAELGIITSRLGMIEARRAQIPGHRVLETPVAGHPTFDAALRWIEANPNLPDPNICPYALGLFGPLLAAWGDVEIRGCVHIQNTHAIKNWHQGRTMPQEDTSPILLARNAAGEVLVELAQADAGWHVFVRRDDTVVRLYGDTWSDALDLFGLQAHTFVQGSMHQRLHAQHDRSSFPERATRFFAQHRALGAPGHITPDPACVHWTALMREADGFVLGYLWRADGVITAERMDIDGLGTPQDHASLDAAVHWLCTSPQAPDLERFPLHGMAYGPVLWDLSGAKVVGQVGAKRNTNLFLLTVVDQRHQQIGTLMRRQADLPYSLALVVRGGTRIVPCATITDALDQLFRGLDQICPEVPPDEVQDARARMLAFLDDRDRLVQMFRAGRCHTTP